MELIVRRDEDDSFNTWRAPRGLLPVDTFKKDPLVRLPVRYAAMTPALTLTAQPAAEALTFAPGTGRNVTRGGPGLAGKRGGGATLRWAIECRLP